MKVLRALIVDDEEFFLESLVEHLKLRRNDLELYFTSSARKAIEILRNTEIHILVTDIKMPEISGLQLLRFVVSEYPLIRTIVMTAYGNEEVETEVWKSGAAKYISKPFDIDKFEAVLEDTISEVRLLIGSIAGLSLPEMLNLLKLEGKSIVLYLSEEKNYGKIWIEEGKIVHATTFVHDKAYSGRRALELIFQWFKNGEVKDLPYVQPLKQTIDDAFVERYLRQSFDSIIGNTAKEEILEDVNIIENRFRGEIAGLWIVNIKGKVIFSKIYNDKIFRIRNEIFKEIKSQFYQWKNKKFLIKEQYIRDINGNYSCIFKILLTKENYIVFAVLSENEMSVQKQGGETMPGQKEIEKALELLSGIEGSEGAAVVSDEGLVLDARLDKKYNPDKIGALISVALEAAEKVTKEAGWGEADNMVVEGKEGKMVIYSIPMGFVVLLGKKTMNLGLARMQVDQAAEILGG